MRITRYATNSRLARRMVLLFVFAALLPMLVLAWLSFRQVSGELVEQGGVEARRNTKQLGMDIFERLNYLSKELSLFSHNLRTGEPISLDDLTEEGDMVIDPTLDALFTLDPDGRLTNLIGSVPYNGTRLMISIITERSPGMVMFQKDSNVDA